MQLPAIDYHALAPELVLAFTVLTVIILDLFLPEDRKWITAVVGIFGLMASAVPLLTLALSPLGDRALFGDSYVVDDFALVVKALFIITGYITLLMSVGYVESDRYYEGEFYFLLLASVLGGVVMASSRDLISLFIGLELVSGPAFLLSGWRKGDRLSNEAALKFFLIGVLSVAIMLYGMSMLYGLTGEITFEGIREASAAVASEPAFILAGLFILVGFAFKVSAVPFHFWAPDTYEGAPTPVTAYLSVGSKAAGFVGLLVLTYQAFAEVAELWGALLWLLAALSMTAANLVALRQQDVVRLLAYSSVAQAGFMLVPFAAAVTGSPAVLEDAFGATVTYVLIYAFMNLGAFAAVMAAIRRSGSDRIDDWRGLGSYAPGIGLAVGAFFFSLAGIPPLAGWFAKFVMFRAILIDANGWGVALAVIAAINAVLALFYYARVVKLVWMDPVPVDRPAPALEGREPAPSLVVALAVTAVVVLVVGIYPQILAFFGEASTVLAAP